MALSTPDFLQVKTYSAKALRAALMDRAIQAGVYGPTDLLVAQRAGGANMSVDIGVGSAWVLGTTSSRQGAYHVYNDAVLNVAIAANASGQPRLDQIVLHVYDSIDGGAGTDTAAIEVIQGVGTAGATLDTRTGAAALPANCLRLADVIVANGAASIVNANIRDRRPWARGAYTRIFRNTNAAGGTNYTTTATNSGLIDGTNLAPRIECSGVPVRITARGRAGTTAGFVLAGFFVDGAGTSEFGTGSGGEDAAAMPSPPGGTDGLFLLTYDFVPTAGSHVIAPTWRISTAGTGTILVNNAGVNAIPFTLTIEELVRQNTANNPAGYG